ncbi:MAG: hypothetical protein ABSE73_15475 [Planctomycetota bacterium]
MASGNWTTFDVVRAILAHVIDKAQAISAETPVLHGALYDLAKEDKFKPYLNDFTFEQRGDFPFSREFHTQLVALEMAGHLSCQNPDFVQYHILPKMKTHFQKRTKRFFTDEEIADIGVMADRFALATAPVAATA